MSGSEGRFYEAEFPQLEDIVVVQVRRIVDMGAYVSLLEYNGKEGMMLLSELSKRRIRSVSKLLRVGRTEICMVLRVDEEKGYIDLSKRRVAPEDGSAKEEYFAKSKAVHGIMRHVAGQNDINVEELCMKISWPLHKKYGNAYEAFRKHVNEEINVWDEIDFSQPGDDLSDKAVKLKEDIEVNLRRRLIQQMLRLRAKVEVSCTEYEGIDAIKKALLKGMEASKEECELKIRLVACPLFILSCQCREKELGFGVLNEAMAFMKEAIEKEGGSFVIKVAPELVGREEDEKEDEEESGEEGSDDDSQEAQDETMGGLTAEQMAALGEEKIEEDEDDAAK